MPKRTVNHHASIVVVRAEDSFFFNGYDAGYPRKEWVGCLNPLGGNHELGDVSPYSLLEREVREELTDPERKFENFAEPEARALREAVMANAAPYQDFVVFDPIIEKNKSLSREQRSAIVSLYTSNISLGLMIEAQHALRTGNRLTSEGDGGNVVSFDDLVSGKRHLAWTNPFMMRHYLGRDVPYLREAEAEPIGLPRETLAAYFPDFDYIKPIG